MIKEDKNVCYVGFKLENKNVCEHQDDRLQDNLKFINDASNYSKKESAGVIQDTEDNIDEYQTDFRKIHAKGCQNLPKIESFDVQETSNLKENFVDFQNNIKKEVEENQNDRAEQIRAFQEKLKQAMISRNVKITDNTNPLNDTRNCQSIEINAINICKDDFNNAKLDSMEFTNSFNQKDRMQGYEDKVNNSNKYEVNSKDANVDEMDCDDSCEIKAGASDTTHQKEDFQVLVLFSPIYDLTKFCRMLYFYFKEV